VHVPVDRQRPPLAERLQEALDLSSHLLPNLSAQPDAFPHQSVRPECGEPSTESAAAVYQQIKLARGREGRPLEQIQMQADRKVRTTPEFGDGMFPTGAVDDDTGAAEPPPVMTGHDSIGYAFGQTAVVGMKKRHQPRETADSRRVNRGHGMEQSRGPASRQFAKGRSMGTSSTASTLAWRTQRSAPPGL
jgi:hypothetical protein